MKPYYADDSVTLWHGDSLAVLRALPDTSVDCCVTSPPYFGLRDYGEAGQYGLEASPAEYVETMRVVFAEVHRVLADDGTLWLNIGDSYSGGGGGGGGKHATIGGFTSNRNSTEHYARMGLGPKNLMGIPWRTAFALQDDGWILRNDVIWSKPNAMPESVTDRLSSRHEHLFMCSKSRSYWFDLDPIREPVVYSPDSPALNWARDSKEADVPGQSMRQHRATRPARTAYHDKSSDAAVAVGMPPHRGHRNGHEGGKNPGDVWTIATQPFSEAHFAVMPQALAERAILAGCKPGGVVLDPFSGSGTTGLAAAKHGRRYVGIDLSRDYLDLSLRTRLGQATLMDGGVA
jgi:DNA modification methylase